MGFKRPSADNPNSEVIPEAKKRKGFSVGPANLPDGAWKRRNIKIKEDLIHKAKLKKEYKKVKAELQQEKNSKNKPVDDNDEKDGANAAPIDTEQDRQHVNSERQALLDGAPMPPMKKRDFEPQQERIQPPPPAARNNEAMFSADDGQATAQGNEDSAPADYRSKGDRRKPRRPDYYDKALQQGSQKKVEAETRAAEQKRREEEREQKAADRERVRKAMLKARGIRPGGRPFGRQEGPRKLGRESKVLLDKVKMMVGRQ